MSLSIESITRWKEQEKKTKKREKQLIRRSFSRRNKGDKRLLITVNRGVRFCSKRAYENYSVIVTKRIRNTPLLYRFALSKAYGDSV